MVFFLLIWVRNSKVPYMCQNGQFVFLEVKYIIPQIIRRLEFRHTPKHGSWLNIAENELSSMTRQCVKDRRFATIEALRTQTAAWQEHSNAKQRGVDWQFKVGDARVKLKSVYPKIIV